MTHFKYTFIFPEVKYPFNTGEAACNLYLRLHCHRLSEANSTLKWQEQFEI